MSTERRDHWKEKLSESREALFALLAGLSPEQWQTTVFAEGERWTVATVLAHLVESERGMSIHVHKIRKAIISQTKRAALRERRRELAVGVYFFGNVFEDLLTGET